jgi:hypothetical protein
VADRPKELGELPSRGPHLLVETPGQLHSATYGRTPGPETGA